MKQQSKNLKGTVTNQNKSAAKPSQLTKKDLLDILDSFFLKKKELFFYFGLVLTVLFSLLLFDIKVSTGGDDSSYITMAYNFIHKFQFPTFQGPLYPIFLSVFVGIFGINLFVLKLVSLFCVCGSMFFYYKTFSGKLPQSLLGFSFIFLSINAFLLYYSSQTYSEAFFLLLQSIIIWFIASRITDQKIENDSIKFYLMLGAMLFLATLARNVAYASMIGVTGFFVLQKGKWKKIPCLIGGFAILYFAFGLLKKVLWKNEALQIASQGKAIFYKDYFNPTKGNEDFMGFVQRFLDNSHLFFSKHIFNFLGFKIGSTEINPFLTIVTWGVFLIGLYLFFRKNKLLFLVSVYTLSMCSVTFLAVQKQWDQSRMIIVYLPYFILLISGGFYYGFKASKNKMLQVLFPLFFLVVLFSTFKNTMTNVKSQSEVLSHNLQGDKYYGFTPDWVHYFQISEWAAKNLASNDVVGCRKAPMSFIYSGGRDFYGIYKVPMQNIDSVKIDLLNRNAKVIIIDNYELQKKGVSQALFDSCRSSIKAMILNEKHFYTIFEPTAEKYVFILSGLEKNNLVTYTDINQFFNDLKASNESYYAENPDQLIKNLKDSKVKYLIVASLRENPSVKSENVINTIHKLVFFIQLKYPEIARVVHQIGAEDDEPAQILELKYN